MVEVRTYIIVKDATGKRVGRIETTFCQWCGVDGMYRDIGVCAGHDAEMARIRAAAREAASDAARAAEEKWLESAALDLDHAPERSHV